MSNKIWVKGSYLYTKDELTGEVSRNPLNYESKKDWNLNRNLSDDEIDAISSYYSKESRRYEETHDMSEYEKKLVRGVSAKISAVYRKMKEENKKNRIHKNPV